MATFQPDSSYRKEIVDFVESLDELLVPGILCHAPSQVPRFFPRSTLEQRVPATEIGKLLRALFPRAPPADIPDARRVHRKCLKVFCVLLRIDRGQWIDEFLKHGAHDDKLPFNDSGGKWPSGAKDFFEDFKKEQWAFSAPVLEIGQDHRFDPSEILPIISKEEIQRGGCATIYKIRVHPDYNELSLPDALGYPKDSFTDTFALKTYYAREFEGHYHSEIAAYKNIRSNGPSHDNGVTEYLGSFRQGDSYNIVLEYADGGSLEQHFQSEGPRTVVETLSLYHALFNSLKGLNSIHQPAQHESVQGIHQDVKPSNILYVGHNPDEPYTGLYKLSDPGLSQFYDPDDHDKLLIDAGGTKTYGAPECYRPDQSSHSWRIPITKEADIWSLGCVFHEAITWAILGKEALVRYRIARGDETLRILGFRDGNCFHGGRHRLNVVKDINDDITTTVARRDDAEVTVEILNLVNDMLAVDPVARPTAVQLWRRWKPIESKLDALRTSVSSPREAGPRTPPGMPSYRVSTWSSGRTERSTPDIDDHMHRITRPRGPQGSQTRRRTTMGQNDDWLQSSSGAEAPAESPPLQYRFQGGINAASTFSGNGWAHQAQEGPLEIGAIHRPPTYGNNNHQNHHRRQNTLPTTPPNNNDQHRAIFGNIHANYPVIASHATVDDRIHDEDPRPLPQTNENVTQKAYQPRVRLTAEVPILEVSVAQRWREHQRNHRRRMPSLRLFDRTDLYDDFKLPFEQYREELNQRDHVFLIDDSEPMHGHWDEVISLLDVLMYIVKRTDKDGVEMFFTMSDDKYKSTDTSEFIKILRKKSNEMLRRRGLCNMGFRLGSILYEYQRSLEQLRPSFGRTVKPLNLYVFTTGDFQPNSDVPAPISRLTHVLKQYNCRREQLGIQFIRFGDSHFGKILLESLDDELVSQLGATRDIVDTEPSRGNVWKMLLGATNKWFDGH